MNSCHDVFVSFGGSHVCFSTPSCRVPFEICILRTADLSASGVSLYNEASHRVTGNTVRYVIQHFVKDVEFFLSARLLHHAAILS